MLLDIVAYRTVAKQWLCKQQPLLGNERNIHTRNNKTAGLSNPFLSNGSVNTPTTIEVLLETVFSIRSLESGYKEEFSWESAVESKWVVSRELSSARNLTLLFAFMPSMCNFDYYSIVVFLYWDYMFRPNRPSLVVQVVVVKDGWDEFSWQSGCEEKTLRML
jgi:hypothetical protein